MFQNYIAYIQDNPKGYWFRAKLYGWGWTPARWQGWVTLLVFIDLVFLNFWRLDKNSHSSSDTLINFLPETAVLVLLFIAVCYWKGEKPRWQWGLPKQYRS